tara:strand:+ start:51991 stop:52926 length:936 start_codon:yes stop_codon:yes gene_type:complete
MNDLSHLELISARMDLYQCIRQYFGESRVLEVEVPLLGAGATTDPQINSFRVASTSGSRYLQSSPEYFLKRLLTDISRSIFTITKAFRDEEFGGKHNPEFSMLEWYRLDAKLDEIIEDTLKLVGRYLGELPVVRETYHSVFQRHLQINPHQTSIQDLQALVEKNTSYKQDCVSVDEALQFLLCTLIEPQFESGITILSDFPVNQAALAEIEQDDHGQLVAKRFELYLGQTELANGYQELTDPDEQRLRFEQDNLMRAKLGRKVHQLDEALLNAMAGMPSCSGVAMGLDRLLMAKLGIDEIEKVLLFPWSEA